MKIKDGIILPVSIILIDLVDSSDMNGAKPVGWIQDHAQLRPAYPGHCKRMKIINNYIRLKITVRSFKFSQRITLCIPDVEFLRLRNGVSNCITKLVYAALLTLMIYIKYFLH